MTYPAWYQKLPTSLLEELGKKYALDPFLIGSICQKETAGEKWKSRYEPTTDRYVINAYAYASRLGITQETERLAQMHSWGIMQVMGFKAREIGYTDYLPKLSLLEVGMELGCQILKKLSERYEEESQVISAYNQGSPRKTPGGLYLNQRYVDQVSISLRELRALA
jgi:hypothetical protein